MSYFWRLGHIDLKLYFTAIASKDPYRCTV